MSERDGGGKRGKPGTPTPHEFLAVVFAGREGEIWTTAVAGDPEDRGAAARGQWQGQAYEPERNFDPAKNLYFGISELAPGATQRRAKDFRALRMVILDDIGSGGSSKVDPKKVPLRPTYRIETSPDNEQWGLVLDAPLTDAQKATRLLDAVKGAGATDKGGVNLMRYGRLPGGVNGKRQYGARGFAVRLREWAPERVYTPEAIASAFGADLEGRRGRPREKLPLLTPDADPLLKLLGDLGVLRAQAPNERGFVTITCPWSDQHTGDDDTAGYAPGGAFKCFHDHCVERGISDLLAWMREQGCAVDDAIVEMPGPRGGALRAVLRYLYARDVDRFVDREQGTFVEPSALDRYLANEMRGFKPTKVLLDRDDLLRVLSVVYLPGKPEVLEMNENGRPVVATNTWRPGPIGVAANGDAAVLRPYFDHLAWLFPEPVEETLVLDFITHLVQRRGIKVNWMLVALAQVQGSGRDTLLKPIRDILGVHNVASISAEDLFGQFNEWEARELVCFSEADSPEHNRWRVYKALKPKVVKPDDMTRINRKHIAAQQQEKVANYVMLTNDPGAVAMDRDDRRVGVVETPHRADAVLRYTNTGVFGRLHALYGNAIWMQMLHRYLLDRPISAAFDAAGRAPKTPAWGRMFEASRSSLEVFVEEAIDERMGAFGYDLARLRADLLVTVQVQPGLSATTDSALMSALRRVGAVRLPDFKDQNHKNVKGVWALRDAERYLAMSAAALRETWAKREQPWLRTATKY